MAGSSGSKTAMIVVFVLVGGFALIAILGIIAAIAIPNLMTAEHRSKQKRTMADLRAVSMAIEAYATDHSHYPSASGEELRGMLSPTYIRDLSLKDGWTHDMRYQVWSQGSVRLDRYAVGSAGKDGIWQHESLQEYTQGETQNFDCDIVFSNGSFVQYPEGIQRSTN